MPRPEMRHLGDQWGNFVKQVRQNPTRTFPETTWDFREGNNDAILAQYRYFDTRQQVSKVLEVALERKGYLTIDPGRKQRQRHTPTLSIFPTPSRGVGVRFKEQIKKDEDRMLLTEVLVYNERARLEDIRVDTETQTGRSVFVLDLEGHVLQTGIHHPSADLGLQVEGSFGAGPFEFWLRRRNRLGPNQASREDRNWFSTELRWGFSDLEQGLLEKGFYTSPEFPYEASPIALMEMVRAKLKATIGEGHMSDPE